MKWIKFTLFLVTGFVFALLDPAVPPAGAGEEFASGLEEKWTGDLDQESTLDHKKRSKVGAVGIMQVLPSTAADKNVGIPDVENLESNIHAGTKYLRFIRNRYFNDPAIDGLNQTLFAFASYNAGPAKVARLRKEAQEMGLDFQYSDTKYVCAYNGCGWCRFSGGTNFWYQMGNFDCRTFNLGDFIFFRNYSQDIRGYLLATIGNSFSTYHCLVG